MHHKTVDGSNGVGHPCAAGLRSYPSLLPRSVQESRTRPLELGFGEGVVGVAQFAEPFSGGRGCGASLEAVLHHVDVVDLDDDVGAVVPDGCLEAEVAVALLGGPEIDGDGPGSGLSRLGEVFGVGPGLVG